MCLRTRPLFTEIVREAHDFRPEPGVSYIYGRSGEPRSSHVEEWASEATDIGLVEIEYASDNSFRLDNATFNLRGTEQLKQFVERSQFRYCLSRHNWSSSPRLGPIAPSGALVYCTLYASYTQSLKNTDFILRLLQARFSI